MNKRRFRFGVTSYGAESSAAWVAKAKRVEELGYSTLLIPDHFIGQLWAMPALAVAGAVTTSLRLGTVVCDNDFRHPIVLAKEAATIDFLSGGRFELGIGAGWLKAEHDALGIGFDPPGVRVSRLAEAVEIIKAYLGEERVKFSGRHYQVDSEIGIEQTPRPVQKPRPPLLIGAGGKRMLALAGREADIVSVTTRTSAEGTGPDMADIDLPLSQRIEWLQEAAGDRFESLELHVQTWAAVITNNRREVAEGLSRGIPVAPDKMLSMPYLLAGTMEEIISSLEEYREKYGITYYSIFDRYMEGFAPVVARLAGE